jgi:type III restriction enzyme
VDSIKYQRLGGEYYYVQELFEQEELTAYLKNMLAAQKSVYEQVVYDSATEATFAEEFKKNFAVTAYAKLSSWFTVPMPLGSYNRDWAILIQTGVSERLYFVIETKSSLLSDDLRDKGRCATRSRE